MCGAGAPARDSPVWLTVAPATLCSDPLRMPRRKAALLRRVTFLLLSYAALKGRSSTNRERGEWGRETLNRVE